MKKIGIVSCDKWIDKLEEDNNLKNALINLGIDAKIISWQQPLEEVYDLLVLRSVWGYQNFYKEYGHKFLAIKDKKVLGAYDSVTETISDLTPTYEVGSYIIQECTGDESAYRTTIMSLIIGG